jgi:hypothetical protein
MTEIASRAYAHEEQTRIAWVVKIYDPHRRFGLYPAFQRYHLVEMALVGSLGRLELSLGPLCRLAS